jgi:hypothetical protein
MLELALFKGLLSAQMQIFAIFCVFFEKIVDFRPKGVLI